MNSQGQNIGSSVDELGGHAQEALDRLSDSQSGQNNTYTSQASTFLSQKGEQLKNMAQGAGEQVKSMAQGAAEAVKNTLGMSNENPGDYTRKCVYSFPSLRAITNHPGRSPGSFSWWHPPSPRSCPWLLALFGLLSHELVAWATWPAMSWAALAAWTALSLVALAVWYVLSFPT
ncbi:hypothetical protein Q3G72_034226 [Acer saccharum]|nr:hypothetical protein Q3G72_034226 [Acer saccharum]